MNEPDEKEELLGREGQPAAFFFLIMNPPLTAHSGKMISLPYKVDSDALSLHKCVV